MSTTLTPKAPQGAVPAVGVPDTQDYPRLVFTAPYFETYPLAELIAPAVTEAVEAQLPGLVPPYVDQAAIAAVQANAVLLGGSTMSGPLYLSPTMPTQPSQAASMAYVDSMIATAGIPEVPTVPAGQTWARQTGQWVPIAEQTGVFLPLAGGTMQGQINMSGNAITNLPALPVMPNGAAPAQWVLNQIAAQSLYQGTWNADTYTPDLTQPQYHVNGYTWICITTSTTGVVVSPPIPGLQGITVFNGDNIIFSAIAGVFQRVAGGGLSLAEANALYVALAGSQMSGALLLNANATSAMQAVPLQQVESLVSSGGLPEAPNDGQIYGRQGLAHSWMPVLPIGGGILTGALTLSGNAAAALNAVPLQQLTGQLAGYVPLGGGVTMTGPLTMNASAILTLGANAAAGMQAVPLQQLTSTLASYALLNSPSFIGDPTAPTPPAGDATTSVATTAFVQSTTSGISGHNIGRNVLHNAMFNVQQRGAGPWTTANVYTADRWQTSITNDTASFSLAALADTDRSAIGDEAATTTLQNTFTGSATANSTNQIIHKIENVRRLSGKTVVISFWARGATALNLGLNIIQYFGTGGTPSAPLFVNATGTAVAVGTTWSRYTATFTIPSAAGKTLGTNNDHFHQVIFVYSAATGQPQYGIGVQSGTVQLWGVQLEIAQPGQTQPTPLEKPDTRYDLANCQRFYQNFGQVLFGGYASAAESSFTWSTISFAIMRTTPTVTLGTPEYGIGGTGLSVNSATADSFTLQLGATAAGNIWGAAPVFLSADL